MHDVSAYVRKIKKNYVMCGGVCCVRPVVCVREVKNCVLLCCTSMGHVDKCLVRSACGGLIPYCWFL